MRLVILGVVRGILPDERAAILRLQVNFLGVIDFEQERFSFDASLFDSKLLAFTLTGDMAMRLYWGANANFLLTVGGFHPAYQPPPMNLPALRRLTLALVSGRQPAPDAGDLFRGHLEHRAVRGAAGAVRGGVEVQRLRLSVASTCCSSSTRSTSSPK